MSENLNPCPECGAEAQIIACCSACGLHYKTSTASTWNEHTLNARLIAYAPDMYKFIQTLYELITNPEEDEEGLSLRFVSEAAKQILDRINVKGGEV